MIDGGSLVSGATASIATSGGSVVLQVTGGVANLVWTGDGGANQWNINTAANWLNGGSPSVFNNNDLVTFDATGSANPTVDITATVSPSAVTVNAANDYAFTGAGKISGTNTLTKSGGGALTISTANDYTGGTVVSAGALKLGANNPLGTGAVTFSGNGVQLSSDGGTARLLTNNLTATTNVVLGDAVNTGTLTLGGVVDLNGGATRFITNNSKVVIAGSLTNSVSTGFSVRKYGVGDLVIAGNSVLSPSTASYIKEGSLVVDGAAVTYNGTGSFQLVGNTPNSIARLVVTNGGSLFMTNDAGANWRLGVAGQGGSSAATNIFDIAGVVKGINSTYVATANRLLLGDTGLSAIANLWPGGELTARYVTNYNAGTGLNIEFNFRGGILKAYAASTSFISGLTNCFIGGGGGTIDSAGFNITVAQSLLDGAAAGYGSGGFTKAGTGELLLTGTNTYTGDTIVTGGTLTLSNSLAGAVPAGNDIIVNSSGTLEVASVDAAQTITNLISGAGGLAKSGTNYLTIATANTYTGNTTISDGRLIVAHNDALGTAAGGIVVNSGGSLALSNNITLAKAISVRGGNAGQGAIQNIAGSSNTVTGPVTFAANATLVAAGSPVSTIVLDVSSGDAIAAQSYNMDIRGAGNWTINDPISGTGVYLAHGDAGNLSLLALNTFANQVRIDLGTVVANTLANLGSPSSLGTGNNEPIIRIGWQNNAGGRLRYIGTGDSTDRQIQVGYNINNATYTAGATIENAGTGALTFTANPFNSAVLSTTAPRILTLAGTNTDASTIAGESADNDTAGGGTVALVKTNAGTWILTGASTYTAGTTVRDGTLLVNNPSGSGLGTGAVLVTNTGTLGGSGTIGGAVTFATGSRAVFTLGSPLTLNNSLTISGSADVHLNLTNNVPAGSYTLATYSGGSGSFNSTPVIDSGTLVGGATASIVTSGGNVVLQVTSGPANLVWTGDGGANQWDINSSVDWLNGGTPSVFQDNDVVLFNDVGSSNPVVNLSATVTPAYVVVDSSSAYTLTGAGGISGTSAVTNSLSKLGSGLLTLACSNSYTADTVIGQGVLVAANLNALGNGRVQFNPGVGATLRLAQSLNLSSNLTMTTKNGANVDLGPAGTTLTVSSAGNSTCGVIFTNAGKLVKAGTGRMTLIGDSTHTGGTVVSAGNLRIGNGTDVGTLPGDITVNSGALFEVTLAPGFTLNSGQTLGGGGTVTGAVNVAAGAVVRPGLGGVDTSALTFRHALTNAGTMQIALNRTNSPNSAKAVVYGALALGGTLTVTNVGAAPQANDVYTLFTVFAPPTGSFAATNLPALDAGLNWYQTVADTTNVVLLVNQSPTAGTATYTRAAGVGLKNILIADVLTNVTNVSVGQTLSLSGVGSASYGTVSLSGSNIQYAPTGNSTNNDSFSYTISDGRGGTATGTIAVNVIQVTGQDSGTVTVTGNTATTLFYGVPGWTYLVQRNTNLLEGAGWKAISTNVVPPSGLITNVDNFGDLSVPPYPAEAFYRLQTQ